MKVDTSHPIKRILVSLAAMAVCFYQSQVMSFELTPIPTKSERFQANKTSGIIFKKVFPIVEFGLHRFTTPVHEALTQLGYECSGTIDECADVDLDFAGSSVIAGIRWNDDPPFQFQSGEGNYPGCSTNKSPPPTISFALNTDCWINHFKDVAAISRSKPDAYAFGNGTMLARSHFGDLQFLHAMAAKVQVSPVQTKAKLMMWAEFTWRVQTVSTDYISAETLTGAVPVFGFQDHFPVQERRSVTDLFTVGRPWMRNQLEDIAFGSLLHMVEDSFAGGHIYRRAVNTGDCQVPEIVEFHTYPGQDQQAHKERDDLDHARAKPILVDVLRELIRLRHTRKSWTEVRPYLDDCVFRLASDARSSSILIDE
jgi:hypothetical protein